MEATFTESLVINGEEIHVPTITQRAYQHALSDDPLRSNFGEMMAQVLALQTLSEKQRLYIAEMLEEQLEIELQTQELISSRGL
jgi:hypothetical protein